MFPAEYVHNFRALTDANLIRCYVFDEAAGNPIDYSQNGVNATYTGPTLQDTTGFDGRLVATWDGVNDYVDGGLGIDTAIPRWSSGTMFAWVKISGTGILTDGTQRCIFWYRADGDNQVVIRRHTGANQFEFRIELADTIDNLIYTIPAGDRVVKWLQFAITWNWTGAQTEIEYYYEGGNVGSDTNANQWENVALDTGDCKIGSFQSGLAQFWSGSIGFVAIMDGVMSSTDIAAAYRNAK